MGDCSHGQQPHKCETCEVIAERDRLRAVVERAHDHVGVDEHVLRSLATDDLVALVGVLRRDCAELRKSVELANAAADAAAEAVGNMAEYTSQAVAERDRLRVVVDAARATVAGIEARLRERATTLASHSEQVAADEALMAAGDVAAVLDQLDVSGEATGG